MKKLITISLLTLAACGPSREEFEMREKVKSDSIQAINEFNIQVEQGFKVSNEELKTESLGKIYNSNSDFIIGIYQVNSCEYLSFKKGECINIIHSGNCNNPIHQIKENINL